MHIKRFKSVCIIYTTDIY